MTAKVIRPKDRQEWLQLRGSGIGSSEVATIIGLNPWETPYMLWRRKTGREQAKPENFAMRAGHILEDAVAQFFQEDSGHTVIKSSAGDWLVVDDERPYMRVSPDRTFYLEGTSNKTGNKGILECKTTQKTIDPDDLPKHWFCQLQYQLGVAGYERGALAWLTAGRDFDFRFIDFAPDFYGWLTEEVERFWTDYVQKDVEPPLTSVADCVMKYSRHTDGKTVECTTEVVAAIERLKDVKAQIKDLETAKTDLEDTVKMFFTDAEALTFEGKTLATWKAPKPSMRFDDKRFVKECPVTAKEYMREVQGARRLLIK